LQNTHIFNEMENHSDQHTYISDRYRYVMPILVAKRKIENQVWQQQ